MGFDSNRDIATLRHDGNRNPQRIAQSTKIFTSSESCAIGQPHATFHAQFENPDATVTDGHLPAPRVSNGRPSLRERPLRALRASFAPAARSFVGPTCKSSSKRINSTPGANRETLFLFRSKINPRPGRKKEDLTQENSIFGVTP
jgi:hypothetical protein